MNVIDPELLSSSEQQQRAAAKRDVVGRISSSRPGSCRVCKGTGLVLCSKCKGSGYISSF
jgi:DnaJ-class molecular chaperone